MPVREVAAGAGAAGNEQPKVDIVAVHGLNPWGNPEHAYDTWRKPKGEHGGLWLRDELPKAIPNARIFLYQYDSSPAFGTSKDRFVHQANDLLERVHVKRTTCADRPIIFIGHSLGGILIKQALVNAHNNARYKPLKDATTGLVFFGTPHAGGKDALVTMGKIASRVATKVLRNPSKDVMEALQKGSQFSDVLQEGWRHQLTLYKIVSFYEGIGDIVPRESAVLGLSGDVENQVRLEADHSGVCCFDQSVEDDVDNYEVVCANIQELYDASIKRSEAAKESSKPQANDMNAFMSAFNAAGLTDLASYIRPIPEKYEGLNVNYHAVLMQDPKRSAMHIHAVRNDTRILQAAIKTSYIDPRNSNQDTPFHVAAHMGRPKSIVDFFIKHRADVNAKNNQGNTPLHLYVLAKNMEDTERLAIIDTMLDAGAEVNTTNRNGLTPLGLAVLNNVIVAIEPLVCNGALNHVDERGHNHLHLAVESGNLEALQALLRRDCGCLNSKNLEGNTPLILACLLNRPAMVRALWASGADLDCVNKMGESAFTLAKALNYAECIAALAGN